MTHKQNLFSTSYLDINNTPSLNHGEIFKKNKMKKHLEKKRIFEGFSTNNSSLFVQTNNVLDSTNITPQEESINSLNESYNNALNNYQETYNTVIESTKNYFKRIGKSNPYLEKNITLRKL